MIDRGDVIQNLFRWEKEGKAPPVNVELHPTSRCNLKCIFCEQRRSSYEYKNQMPKKKWLGIIKELGEMKCLKIQISGGGEPMTTPQTTLDMMCLTKKYGMEGKINTNGTLWTKHKFKKSIGIEWDKIIFSIDAPDAKTHDYLRGVKGTFDKTVSNVCMLDQLKKKNESVFPVIEFNTVITNKNYHKIGQMVELANKCGCESITVEPVFITTDFVKTLVLNEAQREDFIHLLKAAQKKASEYGILTNFEGIIEIKTVEKAGNMKQLITATRQDEPSFSSPCYEPWYFPKIGPNGEYGYCCNYPYTQSKLNIRNKTFKEIWFSKELDGYRSNLVTKKLTRECNNCSASRIATNRELKAQLLEYEKNK